MMNSIERLRALRKVGGTKAVALKVTDKLTGSSKLGEYLYDIQKSAKPEEYREILENYYFYCTGEKLNLDHPRTFSDKIQWLKLYDTTPEKTRLADKYLVRDWVKERIGEEYLIPLLGVWDRFSDIDFDTLPDKFVLKCNHGCKWNLVVKDKSTFDAAAAKKKFDQWMEINYAFRHGFELQYDKIPRKIIAEQYIEQLDHDLEDYKFHSFDGEPKLIQVIGNRNMDERTAKECFLSTDWKLQDIQFHTYSQFDTVPPKPVNYEKMLEIARELAQGFAYVRVDLYDLDGEIKFGEMTFTPGSGIRKWGRSATFNQFVN